MKLNRIIVNKVELSIFITLLYFQETLDSFFPNMEAIMQHRQVVLLICGLIRDPTPIIHHVYECWVKDGQKSAGKTLIGLMYNETGLPVPKDLLHNRWINYYDHEKGLTADTSPVYVPSRFYLFNKMNVNISCNIEPGITDVPECTLSITKPAKTVTKNLLSICHKICQHQAVRNLYMEWVFCKHLPEPRAFTISKNMESLKIKECILPTQTLSHLMKQINGCSALRVLDLSWTPLTGCLSGFLPDPHPGLPELEELNLWETALNKDDLQHLSHITQSNKLPKLRILDLSGNTLTGCLLSVLPGNPHCLPQLQELDLNCTRLNKEDLQHLSRITQSNKLPTLRILDLSENTLTGCLSNLLPDNPHGLPELQKLKLANSRLTKDDLQHLTHLIQTHKLPGLDYLDLSFNSLNEKETDVEHLIDACVTHHQRELELSLWFYDLSEAFEEKWKRRCAGTKIELVI